MVTYPRVNILGVGISAININQALASIDNWITKREQQYVCLAAAHTLMSCYYEPDLRNIFNASGLTTPDGMSLVWLLRLYGQRGVRRVYSGDLMPAASQLSVRKRWRHFLYGGEPGVPEALKSTLEKKYPGIRIVGTLSPPFRPLTALEDIEIVERINAVHPDIVWVGMGTGKQERWISNHLGKVNSPVMIGVGAAFDFLSGRKPQAPHWMQRSGLEWLFRLCTEPQRLWHRYAQYPLFVILALTQWLGFCHYPDIPTEESGKERGKGGVKSPLSYEKEKRI